MGDYRIVYGIQCGEFIKVGIASNVSNRLRILRLYNPHPTKIVCKFGSYHARRMEMHLHRLLNDRSVGREWFRITPDELRTAAKHAQGYVEQWEQRQIEWMRKSSARMAARKARSGGRVVDSRTNDKAERE